LIELAEASDLPSQPPVVKVADVVLQVPEVAAGPDEEGVKPGGERFDRVFLSMPICVSLHIQVNNMRGLIQALLIMVSGNSSIFQLFDPLGWTEDSITEGDVEVGYLSVVLDVPVGGLFEYILVVFDAVMKPVDLLFEAADFAGFLGIASGDGGEEPFSNGSEDVCIEIGVGHQGGCNCIGQHRWFWTLDRSDWERDAVLSGQGI
jgi:hypothetical protein